MDEDWTVEVWLSAMKEGRREGERETERMVEDEHVARHGKRGTRRYCNRTGGDKVPKGCGCETYLEAKGETGKWKVTTMGKEKSTRAVVMK